MSHLGRKLGFSFSMLFNMYIIEHGILFQDEPTQNVRGVYRRIANNSRGYY